MSDSISLSQGIESALSFPEICKQLTVELVQDDRARFDHLACELFRYYDLAEVSGFVLRANYHVRSHLAPLVRIHVAEFPSSVVTAIVSNITAELQSKTLPSLLSCLPECCGVLPVEESTCCLVELCRNASSSQNVSLCASVLQTVGECSVSCSSLVLESIHRAAMTCLEAVPTGRRTVSSASALFAIALRAAASMCSASSASVGGNTRRSKRMAEASVHVPAKTHLYAGGKHPAAIALGQCFEGVAHMYQQIMSATGDSSVGSSDLGDSNGVLEHLRALCSAIDDVSSDSLCGGLSMGNAFAHCTHTLLDIVLLPSVQSPSASAVTLICAVVCLGDRPSRGVFVTHIVSLLLKAERGDQAVIPGVEDAPSLGACFAAALKNAFSLLAVAGKTSSRWRDVLYLLCVFTLNLLDSVAGNSATNLGGERFTLPDAAALLRSMPLSSALLSADCPVELALPPGTFSDKLVTSCICASDTANEVCALMQHFSALLRDAAIAGDSLLVQSLMEVIASRCQNGVLPTDAVVVRILGDEVRRMAHASQVSCDSLETYPAMAGVVRSMLTFLLPAVCNLTVTVDVLHCACTLNLVSDATIIARKLLISTDASVRQRGVAATAELLCHASKEQEFRSEHHGPTSDAAQTGYLRRFPPIPSLLYPVLSSSFSEKALLYKLLLSLPSEVACQSPISSVLLQHLTQRYVVSPRVHGCDGAGSSTSKADVHALDFSATVAEPIGLLLQVVHVVCGPAAHGLLVSIAGSVRSWAGGYGRMTGTQKQQVIESLDSLQEFVALAALCRCTSPAYTSHASKQERKINVEALVSVYGTLSTTLGSLLEHLPSTGQLHTDHASDVEDACEGDASSVLQSVQASEGGRSVARSAKRSRKSRGAAASKHVKTSTPQEAKLPDHFSHGLEYALLVLVGGNLLDRSETDALAWEPSFSCPTCGGASLLKPYATLISSRTHYLSEELLIERVSRVPNLVSIAGSLSPNIRKLIAACLVYRIEGLAFRIAAQDCDEESPDSPRKNADLHAPHTLKLCCSGLARLGASLSFALAAKLLRVAPTIGIIAPPAFHALVNAFVSDAVVGTDLCSGSDVTADSTIASCPVCAPPSLKTVLHSNPPRPGVPSSLRHIPASLHHSICAVIAVMHRVVVKSPRADLSFSRVTLQAAMITLLGRCCAVRPSPREDVIVMLLDTLILYIEEEETTSNTGPIHLRGEAASLWGPVAENLLDSIQRLREGIVPFQFLPSSSCTLSEITIRDALVSPSLANYLALKIVPTIRIASSVVSLVASGCTAALTTGVLPMSSSKVYRDTASMAAQTILWARNSVLKQLLSLKSVPKSATYPEIPEDNSMILVVNLMKQTLLHASRDLLVMEQGVDAVDVKRSKKGANSDRGVVPALVYQIEKWERECAQISVKSHIPFDLQSSSGAIARFVLSSLCWDSWRYSSSLCFGILLATLKGLSVQFKLS